MTGFGDNQKSSKRFHSIRKALRPTGSQMDSETGMYYYGARYYDPAVGRFISPDPLSSLAPSWTPYRYGFNNPIIYTDPTGMFESKDEAKQYAKENGIKTGWFRSSKIESNKDGSWSINNRKENSSIGNDKDFGIMKGALVTAQDPHAYKFSESETMRHIKTFGSNLPQYLQDGGDGIALAGYGATASVIGAEVGIPMAIVGNAASTIGSGLEFIQNISNKNFGKAGQNASMYILGEAANVAIDKLVPGPTPKFDYEKVLMDASKYDLGKEILKQNASLKVTGLDRFINYLRDKNEKKP
jgi:RHS repeat-associated protein